MNWTRFPAYLINLDRAPERLDRAIGNIAAAGWIDVTRIPAIDGTGTTYLRDEMVADYRDHHIREGLRPEHDLTEAMMLGEIGCRLSHVRTMGHAMNRNRYPFAVFEDDVWFDPDVIPAEPPDDWVLLMLGGRPSTITRQGAHNPEGWHPVPREFWGTHAYIVRDESTALLLRNRWRDAVYLPSDVGWADVHQSRPAYHHNPPPTKQDDRFYSYVKGRSVSTGSNHLKRNYRPPRKRVIS